MLHVLAVLTITSTLIQISALIGGLLPLAIAFVQQQHWPASVQSIVGVAICAIVSVITAWADGKLNTKDWAACFITIFLMTKTTYLAVWKQTGITDTIRAATTPRSKKVVRAR